MPKLPRISSREAIRALERLGFAQVRQTGSHVVIKKTTEKGEIGCVVPLTSRIEGWYVNRHSQASTNHT